MLYALEQQFFLPFWSCSKCTVIHVSYCLCCYFDKPFVLVLPLATSITGIAMARIVSSATAAIAAKQQFTRRSQFCISSCDIFQIYNEILYLGCKQSPNNHKLCSLEMYNPYFPVFKTFPSSSSFLSGTWNSCAWQMVKVVFIFWALYFYPFLPDPWILQIRTGKNFFFFYYMRVFPGVLRPRALSRSNCGVTLITGVKKGFVAETLAQQ